MKGNKEIKEVFEDITSLTKLINKFISMGYPRENLISLIDSLYNVSLEAENNFKKEEQQQQQQKLIQKKKKKKNLKPLICNKCLLKGHKEQFCNVDISKFCEQCRIKGHNTNECIRCQICTFKGHKKENCTYNDNFDENGLLKENSQGRCSVCGSFHSGECLIFCYKCNEPGHRSRQCNK